MRSLLRVCWVFLYAMLTATAATAQLHEIDIDRLPSGGKSRATYSALLPLEQYAQGWSNKWSYLVPKEQVVNAFSSALDELTREANAAPENHELQLLAGLVAHFAYNLDVERAYEPAVAILTRAAATEPDDIRGDWFLGIHLCQANQGDVGMAKLLDVERRRRERLPLDFWSDYLTCSTVTMMPAHTLQAVETSIQLGANPQEFKKITDIAEKRYKASDAGHTYAKQDAWMAKQDKDNVKFTSFLCGVSFEARGNWGVNIFDVNNGTCSVTLEPPAYPSRKGTSSPTVLLLERPAKNDESLSDFVKTFLKGKYSSAVPVEAARCPSNRCESFEIANTDMYRDEGGAHLLAVAFERNAPKYDGLMLEGPLVPPKRNGDGKVQFFHPEERFHRFPGKLYYLVILDSNVAIFDSANVILIWC